MNRWTIEVRPSARLAYRRLDEGPKRDAAEPMQDLAEDPAMVPATQMYGYDGVWKARFYRDQYRMIYQIAKARKRIVVMRIRPR